MLSPLIAGLFDPGVVAAELRGDGPATLLYPREAAQCARFAPKRIAEFAAGRLCARRALAELGITGFALEANADRSPRWPPGITGSITHTDDYCGAVAATVARYGSIGVDAETVGRITPELDRLLFTEAEAQMLALHDDAARARAATVIFSAKEAFYKCQYQLTAAWRNFTDVAVVLAWSDERQGEFSVHPALASSVRDWGVSLPLRGRFVVHNGLVVTGIASRS